MGGINGIILEGLRVVVVVEKSEWVVFERLDGKSQKIKK